VLILEACELPALLDALGERLDAERPAQLDKVVDGADGFGRVAIAATNDRSILMASIGTWRRRDRAE